MIVRAQLCNVAKEWMAKAILWSNSELGRNNLRCCTRREHLHDGFPAPRSQAVQVCGLRPEARQCSAIAGLSGRARTAKDQLWPSRTKTKKSACRVGKTRAVALWRTAGCIPLIVRRSAAAYLAGQGRLAVSQTAPAARPSPWQLRPP